LVLDGGELSASATLSTGKEPLVPTRQQAGWPWWQREKNPYSCQESNPGCPALLKMIMIKICYKIKESCC